MTYKLGNNTACALSMRCIFDGFATGRSTHLPGKRTKAEWKVSWAIWNAGQCSLITGWCWRSPDRLRAMVGQGTSEECRLNWSRRNMTRRTRRIPIVTRRPVTESIGHLKIIGCLRVQLPIRDKAFCERAAFAPWFVPFYLSKGLLSGCKRAGFAMWGRAKSVWTDIDGWNLLPFHTFISNHSSARLVRFYIPSMILSVRLPPLSDVVLSCRSPVRLHRSQLTFSAN